MQRGFSLVELSIVLVILGLLTGGILAGQSLIRAAEIRKVSTSIAKYQTAIFAFQDKYFALPGDMMNATNFWGSLGGGGVGSGCFTVASTDIRTCNGNGDGYISNPAGASPSDVWWWGERFHVWSHLANAGLIEGSYTGRTDSTTDAGIWTPGRNSPALGADNGAWDIYSVNFVADNTHPFYFNGYNLRQPNLATMTNSPPFTPEEAWNIDTKLDDGKPGTGKIGYTKGSYNACTDSDVPASANYSLTNRSKLCGLFTQIY